MFRQINFLDDRIKYYRCHVLHQLLINVIVHLNMSIEMCRDVLTAGLVFCCSCHLSNIYVNSAIYLSFVITP